MKCLRCGETESWHDWKQKPYCSPYCNNEFNSFGAKVEIKRRGYDADRIIHEFGAKVLSETKEGQIVLNRARRKYRAELVQPGDPEFNKLYGKEVKERNEARRALQEQSRVLWEQKGGRETKILHED